MSQFQAQIDDWVKTSEARMSAVVKTSAQKMGEEVTKPIPQGGRLPVDTGYLRASFSASVNSIPSGAGGTKFAMSPIVLAIAKLKIGDRLIMGFGASYAKYMEARYAFVRSSVQNWPQYVKHSVSEVKRQYR
jgi:hypothetical protein